MNHCTFIAIQYSNVPVPALSCPFWKVKTTRFLQLADVKDNIYLFFRNVPLVPKTYLIICCHLIILIDSF